ncbi:MAG TPA: hypothetical protein VHC41_00855 [Mycobacteriales bacterium]|jgi:hypothetical protein|nr:hypothetical protein [Mycobacteriales bacterium]
MSETATPLKTGARLRSQVCSTEIIVVRPGKGGVALTCGGHPLVDLTATPAEGLQAASGLDTGSSVGKRYTAEADDTLEVLVTKAGTGTLGDGTTPLVLKEAKPLPASD